MKIITSIYLNCRPDLRDEWIPTDADAEVEEALAKYLYADDLLLDESFKENCEQWVQDEYDNSSSRFQDGSETAASSSCDGNDYSAGNGGDGDNNNNNNGNCPLENHLHLLLVVVVVLDLEQDAWITSFQIPKDEVLLWKSLSISKAGTLYERALDVDSEELKRRFHELTLHYHHHHIIHIINNRYGNSDDRGK
ncbi:hypothetical protein Glove_290g39 [Diversispora epigaea]|uniref:Far11/STRP C-terminal domain-containing protein n=1 Tax=Diversispora epigaea TaxID=1348612 RepID=A0A397I8B9_9GLOM|nr:hypothetical protein Glove_290g39 [Diversispora epigaea]